MDTFPEIYTSWRKNGILVARMHVILFRKLEIAFQSGACHTAGADSLNYHINVSQTLTDTRLAR